MWLTIGNFKFRGYLEYCIPRHPASIRRVFFWLLAALLILLTVLVFNSRQIDLQPNVPRVLWFSLSARHLSEAAENVLRLPTYNASWTRRPQFLDSVEVYKIDDQDPLAMTYGVDAPDPNVASLVLKNTSKHVINRVRSKQSKRILVMNHPTWNWIRMGDIGLKDCPVACSLTDDATEVGVVDAIIFYAINMFLRPPKRKPGQVWIFLALESPPHASIYTFNQLEWKNAINWTMTYRSDSDIFYPYGRVNRRKNVLTTNYTVLAEKKTKHVAWFVSHCSTLSRREDYAKKLQEHITVDIFGACGPRRCGREGNYGCLKMLTDDYKFYLSFENTLCKDYVTEKLFRKVMAADIVPIVRGNIDYAKYLPPRSYINVEDFSSVKDLAMYLHYLDKNATAYAEYLEWKNYYFVVEKPNPTCEVCMKLTQQDKYRKVYENVYSWWYGPSICKEAAMIV